jgi:hypothetical protein
MNKSKIIEIVFLLFIIFASGFVIFISFLYSQNGFITPDSSYYLGLSERILNGDGLYLPSSGRVGESDKWFATWPAGYPILISLVSGISHFDVAISSKILNFFLLGASVATLYKFLGSTGLIASLLLLSGGTLQIYSMTWSEAPFISFLIIFCLISAGILSKQLNANIKMVCLLSFLCIFIFLSRYVGAIIIIPLLFLSISLYFQNRAKEAKSIIVSIVILSLFIGLYLLNNLIRTGYLTGIERLPAVDSNLELFLSLTIAVIREFTLPFIAFNPSNSLHSVIAILWSMVGIIIILNFFKLLRDKKINFKNYYFQSFCITGTSYIIGIVVLRWTSQFDIFSNRLLDPGFTLIFTGFVIAFLDNNKICVKRQVGLFLLLTSIISIAISSKPFIDNIGRVSYYDYLSEKKVFYKDLPSNAIVLFGEKELRYIRPNIKIAYPFYTPLFNYDETWDDFLSKLDSKCPIYIETGPSSLNTSRYSESVRKKVNEFAANELIRLN